MLRERLTTAFWKRVAAARNSRLRTRLRPDPSGPTLLLSPHLDDAVLDCWSVLTADAEVEVVNVFAQPPPAGTSTDWDRIAGWEDSAALFSARIAEDRRALERAGRRPQNLPFLELQHRRGRPFPAWSQIDAAVAERVPAPGRVLAPMTLGTVHPDHALVRGYAVALANAGHRVELYADLPYCAVYGWPAWVSGAEQDPHLDVDAYWAPSFAGLPVSPREGRVTTLDDGAAAAKLAAMRTYETQFATLDRGPVGMLSNPAVHRHEVVWNVHAG